MADDGIPPLGRGHPSVVRPLVVPVVDGPPSRSQAIEDARKHTRKWGHREFDFSHRLRFEGEL